MAKVKKIKTIGGFNVKDLFAPQVEGVIQDKKGNLVNRSTGEIYATHKEILKEKQRYQRLVKSNNFELGGERYNSLSKADKEKLKKWGFTKADLKKLAFTNKYSEAMRKSGGNQLKSGALSFSDILYKKKVKKVTKIDKDTGEVLEKVKVSKVKRDARRSPKQNLYSGKTALESRKKFISGQTYKNKKELYKENYKKAILTGNLKASKDVQEALLYAIDNIVNFDEILPDLEETYQGYELHPIDFKDREGKTQKSQNSRIQDMIFVKAYKYISDIQNEELKEKIYQKAYVELAKNPNIDIRDSKYYKAYKKTQNIKDNNLRASLFDKFYDELLKE